MSGDLEFGQLIDAPAYTITISDDDLAGILNIIEECLMRLDDFIDMDYGSYLRPGTRDQLNIRRDDVRALLTRLVALDRAPEEAALYGDHPSRYGDGVSA